MPVVDNSAIVWGLLWIFAIVFFNDSPEFLYQLVLKSDYDTKLVDSSKRLQNPFLH